MVNLTVKRGPDRRLLFSKSQTNRIIRLFTKERIPTSKICKEYKVSCNKIIDLLRENGVEVNLSKIRTKQFSDKQRVDIIKRYNKGINGETTVDIAKDYDCSYATIRKVLISEGVFNPNTGPPNKIHFSPEQIDDIIEKHSQNISANAIAKIFGCCDGKILSVLREHGINTSGYGRGERTTFISDTGTVRTCRALSRRMYREHKDFINPKSLKISKRGYHVDHTLSIAEGLAIGLTALDLAHPCNLQILSAFDNESKSFKSHISKQDLLNSIKSWNRKYGDPFNIVNMELEYQYKYGRYKYLSGKYRECIS